MAINLKTALLVLMATLLSGCDPDAASSIGFRLPDGDPIAGRDAFLYFQCHECHSIAGEDLPKIPATDLPYVELGGEVTRVQTYGALVTSIINPSHKLADGYAADVVANNDRSKMNIYNGHMTVQELIDIVMYLHPFYEVVLPDFVYEVYR